MIHNRETLTEATIRALQGTLIEARRNPEINNKVAKRDTTQSFEGGPNKLSNKASNIWQNKEPKDVSTVALKGKDFGKVISRDIKRNRVRSAEQALNRKNAGDLDFAGTTDMLDFEKQPNEKSREYRKNKGMVTTEARNPENDEINNKIRHPFDGDNAKDIRKAGLRAKKDKYYDGTDYYEISSKDGKRSVNVTRNGALTKGYTYQHPDFDAKNYLSKEKVEPSREYTSSVMDDKTPKRDRVNTKQDNRETEPVNVNKSYEKGQDETIQQYNWAKTGVKYAQQDVDKAQAKLDQAKADRKAIITNKLAQLRGEAPKNND